MPKINIVLIIAIVISVIISVILLVYIQDLQRITKNLDLPYRQCLSEVSQLKQSLDAVSETGGSILSPVAVIWTDPENPAQSPVLNEEEIPGQGIRIEIGEQGFVPSSFEVKNGETVVIVLSNKSDFSHSLFFESQLLSNVAIGVGQRETRAITFFAPQEAGEYEFYCDLPAHASAKGETGKMLVK